MVLHRDVVELFLPGDEIGGEDVDKGENKREQVCGGRPENREEPVISNGQRYPCPAYVFCEIH